MFLIAALMTASTVALAFSVPAPVVTNALTLVDKSLKCDGKCAWRYDSDGGRRCAKELNFGGGACKEFACDDWQCH